MPRKENIYFWFSHPIWPVFFFTSITTIPSSAHTISQTERLTTWQPFSNFIGSSMAKSLCQKFLSIGEFYAWIFKYFIQHCFICRPLDSTFFKYAGIEPRTAATLALAVRRPNP
jgi:hypothetical protein